MMTKLFILVLVLLFSSVDKSEIYLTVLSASTTKATSCLIQISKDGDMIVDDYKTNGICKIELHQGVYTFYFIKCDTSQLELRVVNKVHRVGVFVNDCVK
jgi:hypothetical protein